MGDQTQLRVQRPHQRRFGRVDRPSLLWLSPSSEEATELTSGDDRAFIDDLCERHCEGIELAQMVSVNVSLMVLKVVNTYGVSGTHCSTIDRVDLSSIAGWRKVQDTLRSQQH